MIQSLQFNGGEVFTKSKLLEKIIDEIFYNSVIVNHAVIITNGTLFTEGIEEILRCLAKHIKKCNKLNVTGTIQPIHLELSHDEFHEEELLKYVDKCMSIILK